MSSIIAIGNLTGDPELVFGQSGTPRLTFSIAENIRANKDGQWVDVRTDFHRVTVWRKKAETLAEALRKGMPVIVVGDLESRTVEKDGSKTTYWGITAREVGIIPRDQQGQGSRPAQSQAADPWETGPAPAAGGFSSEPPF